MKIGGSVAPYGGQGWIATADPGPADRGVNAFCGWRDGSDLYQDVDVSGASSLIDAGKVTYLVSAWLGSVGGFNATLTYTFYDWSANQLAPAAQLSQTLRSTALVETSQTGTLPQGTRRVRISLSFPSDVSLADDINFTLAAPSGPPVITAHSGDSVRFRLALGSRSMGRISHRRRSIGPDLTAPASRLLRSAG
jgi:hypothetical protein